MAVERLVDEQPGAAERLASDPNLREAVIAVCGASRVMANLLVADPGALAALADLDRREDRDASSPAALRTWKEREALRIAARDLTGRDRLEATVAAISRCAADVLSG